MTAPRARTRPVQTDRAALMLGYDIALVRRLPGLQRDALAWLCSGWLLSAALAGAPLGHLAWLVTHAAGFALCVSLAVSGLVVIVMRLHTAGGGPGHGRTLGRYAPSGGPVPLMFALGLIFAQPAQLPLLRAELAAPVVAHRRALLAQHERAVAASHSRSDARRYREMLARCEFAALRLQHVWLDPGRALRYTLLYLALLLWPAAWARSGARAALRGYAVLREAQRSARVASHTAQADAAVSAELARFGAAKLPPIATAPREARG
jgi:hypothetical protein